MAKYIGTYATSGDVQTALDNLELSRPFIAYTTDNKNVIYGPAADRAVPGDIVVYSVNDDLLHYIKQADYNTTSYPTASYVPVGVVAYPQADDAFSGVTGEITFMGLNWLDKNHPDTGNTSKQTIEWGYTNFDIPELTNYANSDTAITDMNGKANTEAVLNYATGQTDWHTASAITFANAAGYYPLFECAWRYHTSGTSQGDWYVPACGQVFYLHNNVDILNAINLSFTNLGASTYEFVRYSGKGTSTECDGAKAWRYYKDTSRERFESFGKNRSDHDDGFSSKPLCSKLMTRI